MSDIEHEELERFCATATQEEMIAAGLMEAEWYRDFDPDCDCCPEDWEEAQEPPFDELIDGHVEDCGNYEYDGSRM